MSDVIDDILRREGGFSDHPSDHGGATNFGITRATLADYRGRAVSTEDVRALTKDEARKIYQDRYIDAPRLNQIQDKPLRELLIDCAVHHGPARAVQWLQSAVSSSVDGIIGPATLRALSEMASADVRRRVLAKRIEFFGLLITRDHSQAVFAAGWMARVAELVEA